MRRSDDWFVQQYNRRLALLLLLVAIVTAVAATAPLHRAVLSVIAAAEPVIQEHAVAGAVVFVLLAALSATVFFFSTAVITPIAVGSVRADRGPLPALARLDSRRHHHVRHRPAFRPPRAITTSRTRTRPSSSCATATFAGWRAS
jgi:hypothetical protein